MCVCVGGGGGVKQFTRKVTKGKNSLDVSAPWALDSIVCLPILPPLRCLRFVNLVAWLEPNM